MEYTIVTLEPAHTTIILDIVKSGRQYRVDLYNKETHELTAKRFEKIEKAYEAFEQLTKWYVLGLYSEADKRNYLANC